MFTDEQLEKYADVLWWGLETAREKPYQKGDVILVKFAADTLALAEKVQRKIFERGMHPILELTPTPQMELNLYQTASSEQIAFVAPGEKERYRGIQGLISLRAPASLSHLKSVDASKIAEYTLARQFARKLMDANEVKGDLGWTLCMLPTPALAEAASMSLDAYRDAIVRACFLDKPDPVAEWKRIFSQAAVVKAWLNSLPVDTYQVKSPHMDLTLVPGAKRKWIGVSGHNIPSFELFLSPDYRGTEGVYYSNQPSFRDGNLVEGVTLTFKGGRAVQAAADKGEAFLQSQLHMDAGACRLGEFSLTDRRFSPIASFMANTLFDENFGGEYGNCHVACGNSYLNTYDGDAAALSEADKEQLGFNSSALHWDLVNTEAKQVIAHLKSGASLVIYENGEFQSP